MALLARPSDLQYCKSISNVINNKTTLKFLYNIISIILRACSPIEVGDLGQVGGVTDLSIQSLFYSISRLHVRWGTSPKAGYPVSRSG